MTGRCWAAVPTAISSPPKRDCPSRSSPRGQKKNIKWSAALGEDDLRNARGQRRPDVHRDEQRRPAIPPSRGTAGVLMCFSEANGKFLWQAVHDKLETGRRRISPDRRLLHALRGGGQLFYVSNRAELVCCRSRTARPCGPWTCARSWAFPPTRARRRRLWWSATWSSPSRARAGLQEAQGLESERPQLHRREPGHREGGVAGQLPGREHLCRGSGDRRRTESSTGGRRSSFPAATAGSMPSILPPASCSGSSTARLTRNGTREGKPETPNQLSRRSGDRRPSGDHRDRHRYRHDGPGCLRAIDARKSGDVTATAELWKLAGDEFGASISTVAVQDGLVYASRDRASSTASISRRASGSGSTTCCRPPGVRRSSPTEALRPDRRRRGGRHEGRPGEEAAGQERRAAERRATARWSPPTASSTSPGTRSSTRSRESK